MRLSDIDQEPLSFDEAETIILEYVLSRPNNWFYKNGKERKYRTKYEDKCSLKEQLESFYENLDALEELGIIRK